jgi:16S rRNA (cytidine1402-2'-O)-methyltransferase
VGTLYVVATPIGNLEDVTLRALRVLREVALVLAEDTRHTRVLLDRHGIAAKPLSLHAHNEAARTEQVLALLSRGGDVALVSDAGTPLVSDPGARLVAAAAGAGHPVSPVPGASALLAALSVAGLASDRFRFVGFPPRRRGERRALFESLRADADALVLFESPQRLAGTLAELAECLGPRRACVARELTKLHEEVARGSLAELSLRFAAGARGEVTVVVEGAPAAERRASDPALEVAIRARAAAGGSASQIARDVARAAGVPRAVVYQRLLAGREATQEPDGELGG